ncbi:Glucose-methanol-choline oxidoreductase [Penicillium occitanis (nom. inval.)]|nr:Glucose-methanol-choline oxidoreductase [Penicillium occitanis (nom. inval.)]PCH00626.1 hypothetical protein PENOC_052130 [Penicillium occitanis (nom. inval.)]
MMLQPSWVWYITQWVAVTSSFVAALSSNPFSPPDPTFGVPGLDASYDYVVVGGGTAGLTIAARLTESGSYSVAVVEAGGFYEGADGNLSIIPSDDIWYAGSSPTDFNPTVDWGFITTPQAGMNGRQLHYARGKCLGGSSARNYFTYHHGTCDAYHMWATTVNDSSYEYYSFLPYFKKSVHFTPPDNERRPRNASVDYNPAAFSPTGGPLQVSVPTWANSFSSFAKIGYERLGIQQAVDFVSGTLAGVQYNMNTIDPLRQTRSSSETSYLRMVENSKALRIYNHTTAQRILFNGTTASAVAVQSDNLTYTLGAKREVIVSAGAFQSPQMLMVSGVGPAETLRQFNIPIIADLPGVGQNMWDHILFGANYRVSTLTHSATSNATFLAEILEEYMTKNGSGMLGNPGGDLIAFEKLPSSERGSLSPETLAVLAEFPPDWPEIEYLALDAYSGNNSNYITGAPKTPYMYVSASAAIVAPSSRGNVTITSASMEDPPLINPNWLTHPADQELAVAAFRRIRQLMDTDIVSEVVVGEELLPGRHVMSDSEILYSIRENGIQVFHAAATSVVDSRARVFKTQRLRVVDVSAFPFLPPGHPQATVYALAEKIADDILRGSV